MTVYLTDIGDNSHRYRRKRLIRLGMVMFAGTVFQCGSPKGGDVHGFRMVAFVVAGLPLPFFLNIRSPVFEQVGDMPSATLKSSPGAANGIWW